MLKKINRVFFRIKSSKLDIEKIRRISIDKIPLKDDFFDYSKVIINKPWGQEYLIFKNREIAIWILFIKKGHQTSMHCHLHKKTSISVLSGEVEVTLLSSNARLKVGHGMLFEKGVFHSTRAIEDEVIVMETETPTNKKDLFRLHDSYGREGFGYEGKEYHRALESAFYETFHEIRKRYNVEKNFGQCELIIMKYKDDNRLQEDLVKLDGLLLCVLSGQLLGGKDEIQYKLGDLISLRALRRMKEIKMKGTVELLWVKKS